MKVCDCYLLFSPIMKTDGKMATTRACKFEAIRASEKLWWGSTKTLNSGKIP